MLGAGDITEEGSGQGNLLHIPKFDSVMGSVLSL